MADISQINQGSSITGNSNLGGFLPTAIELDTKPLQQLSAYTVMFNKSQYQQRQQDTDQKIAQLAEISAFDIVNARGKDKEIAIEALATLQNVAKEYAMKGVPKNPQEKLQQELDFEGKIRDAKSKITSINQRGLTYQVRKNEINNNAASSAEYKTAQLKQLDGIFDKSEWNEQISALEKYTYNAPEVPKAVFTKSTTSVNVGNEILQQEVSAFNGKKSMDNFMAANMSAGLVLPENATEQQINQYELAKASGSSKMDILNQSVASVNEVLSGNEYRNADGSLDTEGLRTQIPMIATYLDGVDRYNAYAAEMRQSANNKEYVTKLGTKIPLATLITADDYPLIDKSKPVSAAQLGLVTMFLEAAPDTKDEKIIITNNANEKAKLAVDWFNAKTQRENARRPTGSGGGKVLPDGSNLVALAFKQHVGRIQDFMSNNKGFDPIVPFDSMDADTKKVFGLTSKGDNSFVRYLPDGTAMVGVDKDGKGGSPMTIEQQKFNFIATYKGGNKEEGTILDSKFVADQENGFLNEIGTTDAKAFWDFRLNGGGAVNPASTNTTTKEKTMVVEGQTVYLPTKKN